MYNTQLEKKFRGIGAIVLTPFKEDLSLDLQALEKNIESMINGGLNETDSFLLPNGSTSECYAMNMEERKKVIETCVKTTNGELPILAGCNDNNVFHVIELVNYAEKIGADAALIIQPYYLPFNERQVYTFFEYIHDRTNLPIMIYSNPTVAGGSSMSINLLKELSAWDRIFALKESTNELKRFFHTQVLTDTLLVFSGSSSLQPAASMANMNGFISFVSNFNPRLQVRLWEAIKKEDYEEAKKIHEEELLLYDWWWKEGIEQPFGQVVHAKKAMDLIGLKGGYVRPPLLPFNESKLDTLKDILKKWDLL